MTAPPRLASRRVFVDTSAYFALVDDTEVDHAEAAAILGRLADARYRQYTTNVVLIECHALMLARLGRARAGQFLRSMATSHTTVVRARAQDEDRARAILARYDDKDFSFADAISFVVMQRLGITHAFTLDDHFAQFGFTVLTSRTVL
jgi:predicted nucleic acid-binding protein